MNDKGITQFLLSHAKERPVSFHMPGHKGGNFYRDNGYGEFLNLIADCDITEIPGADNLFQMEGIIADTVDKYRRLYGAKESYLLINGSSAGLMAAIMASVPAGGKLLMARNCHKSVFNGALLAGAEPAYVYPEVIDTWEISGEVSAKEIERGLEENPDACAVILPSPNYYGICSDIEAIAKVVHDAGKVLIVDQAHGAHLKFFDQWISGNEPAKWKSAENLYADVVVNSIHKTLGSFTQSAMVNLCSHRVDRYVFEDKLQLLESTSPSYLLMASLDINGNLLTDKGEALMGQWEKNLQWFYRQALDVPGLKILRHPMLDHTKINMDMSAYGIDGLRLEQLLMERGIFTELVTGNIVMAMSGIGNRRWDYERLLEALKEIASSHKILPTQEKIDKGVQKLTTKRLLQKSPPLEKEKVSLETAAGRVCASSIIAYPPGIPLICPGEVVDEEILAYARSLRKAGQKVIGVDDQNRVVVGKA